MNWITILFLVLIAGWFILPRLSWLGTNEAARRIKDGALLLDVRTPAEFKGMKLPGSKNAPLGSINPEELTKDQDILVYCASGMRSTSAVRQLKSMGFERVWNLGSYGRAQTALSNSKS